MKTQEDHYKEYKEMLDKQQYKCQMCHDRRVIEGKDGNDPGCPCPNCSMPGAPLYLGKANDRQYGGDHYKKKSIEPWDYVTANGLGFFEGNIVKYVTRWRDKGKLEDLDKARHYLDKLIEVETDKLKDLAKDQQG